MRRLRSTIHALADAPRARKLLLRLIAEQPIDEHPICAQRVSALGTAAITRMPHAHTKTNWKWAEWKPRQRDVGVAQDS
jgi:hypothetical protein